MLKIGTLADLFKIGVINGIIASESCGAQGVQLYAWNELNPMTVSAQKLHEVKTAASDHGQKITAICGELSELKLKGHGLQDEAFNQPKLEYLKRTIDMANELGANIVTTHIGVVPADASQERYRVMSEACAELDEYAQSNDSWIAIETGPEKIATLSKFSDQFSNHRIAINYDPANLVMVTQEDEVEGVYTAGKRIVHTHAKDGIMKAYLGPEKVYAIFAEGGIESLEKLPDYFMEVPLGEGQVRWVKYIQALLDINYDGFLTIEREVGATPDKDIRQAVQFLTNLLESLSDIQRGKK